MVRCTCGGTNEECSRCSGKGWYDPAEQGPAFVSVPCANEKTPISPPAARLGATRGQINRHARRLLAKHQGVAPKERTKRERQFRDLVSRVRGLEPKVIGAILREVGYYSLPGYQAEKAERERAIQANVAKYLSSEAGKDRLKQVGMQLLLKKAREEAERLAHSEDFQQTVYEILSQIGSRHVSPENDAFSQACKTAVERKIEQWLQSIRGKEILKAMKEQAIEQRVFDASRSERSSWIAKTLRDMKNDGSTEVPPG